MPGLSFEMRFRNFIIVYALAPVLLLFAVRRPAPRPQNRYAQVVDLTASTLVQTGSEARSGTRIISPAALVPRSWGAAQIPAERLIGPLVVMDLNASSAQIFVDDISNWEAQHGNVPQGAIVAVRGVGTAHSSTSDAFPVSADAAQFLMDARSWLRSRNSSQPRLRSHSLPPDRSARELRSRGIGAAGGTA